MHGWAAVFWAGNLPMLVLRPVRESVPYVAFCSVYANFVGHLSSWQATRVEVNQQEGR